MQFRHNDLNNPEFVLQHEEEINKEFILHPENPDIYIVRACLEMHKGNYQAALYLCKMAIGFDPDKAGYCATIATCLGNLGEIEESGKWLKRGYELSKTCPVLNWNYGLWLLQNGNFELGFDLYRWRKIHLPGHKRLLQEEYSPLVANNKDRTLLIWTEQGLGDQVMMFRFVRYVKETFGFGRVILECPPEMYNLFNTNAQNVDQVYLQPADFSTPFEYDEHLSLMDLGYYMGVSSESNFHGTEPYIFPNPIYKEKWEEGFKEITKLRIGICWRGSPGHVNDKKRSASLIDFVPLGQLGTLISLDKNPDPPQIPDEIKDNCVAIGSGLVNADFTASLIDNLDVVVTVDSFIAHLAGAMGKKVFLLLPKVHEWRWGLKGEGYSYLYPNVFMIKQKEDNDWSYPIAEVCKLINEGNVPHRLAENN